MKKIFTLAFIAMMASVAYAQDLVVTVNGSTVNRGDVVTCDNFTEVIPSVMYEIRPQINVMYEYLCTVNVTIKSLDSDSDVACCALDGQCVKASEANQYTIAKSGTLAANQPLPENDQKRFLYWERTLTTPGTIDDFTSRVEVTLEAPDEGLDPFTFQVNFVKGAGSVNGLSTDKAKVTEVYSLDGRTLGVDALKTQGAKVVRYSDGTTAKMLVK